MKKNCMVVLALLSVAMLSVVSFSSCTKNKTKILIKKWTIEQVKIGTKDIGVDVTPAFKGATFDFKNDGTYTMSKGEGEDAGKVAKLLPSEGKWEMDEKDGTWVKLNGVKYTIQEEGDGKLHLQGAVYLLLK